MEFLPKLTQVKPKLLEQRQMIIRLLLHDKITHQRLKVWKASKDFIQLLWKTISNVDMINFIAVQL